MLKNLMNRIAEIANANGVKSEYPKSDYDCFIKAGANEKTWNLYFDYLEFCSSIPQGFEKFSEQLNRLGITPVVSSKGSTVIGLIFPSNRSAEDVATDISVACNGNYDFFELGKDGKVLTFVREVDDRPMFVKRHIFASCSFAE